MNSRDDHVSDIFGATYVDYHEPSDTYRAEFGEQTGSAAEAIVAAVARATETAPLDLPPLEAAIDTDALNRLVNRTHSGPSPCQLRISFEYQETTVTVNSHSTVIVDPTREDPQ